MSTPAIPAQQGAAPTPEYSGRHIPLIERRGGVAEAARLGLAATLTFPAPGAVEARLAGIHGKAAGGERLTLRFAHATRSGADVRVRLTRSAGGGWRGALPPLPPGKWYAELGNEQWRLAAPARMPASAGKLALRALPPPDRR